MGMEPALWSAACSCCWWLSTQLCWKSCLVSRHVLPAQPQECGGVKPVRCSQHEEWKKNIKRCDTCPGPLSQKLLGCMTSSYLNVLFTRFKTVKVRRRWSLGCVMSQRRPNYCSVTVCCFNSKSSFHLQHECMTCRYRPVGQAEIKPV